MSTLILILLSVVVTAIMTVWARQLYLMLGAPMKHEIESSPVFRALNDREARSAATLLAIVDHEKTKTGFIKKLRQQIHDDLTATPPKMTAAVATIFLELLEARAGEYVELVERRYTKEFGLNEREVLANTYRRIRNLEARLVHVKVQIHAEAGTFGAQLLKEAKKREREARLANDIEANLPPQRNGMRRHIDTTV